MERGYVYILANWTGEVLYTGVTANLKARVYQHKTKSKKSFTQKYRTDRLVYFEELPDIVSAIKREKQFKGGSRRKKIEAIERLNPTWKDLYSFV